MFCVRSANLLDVPAIYNHYVKIRGVAKTSIDNIEKEVLNKDVYIVLDREVAVGVMIASIEPNRIFIHSLTSSYEGISEKLINFIKLQRKNLVTELNKKDTGEITKFLDLGFHSVLTTRHKIMMGLTI